VVLPGETIKAFALTESPFLFLLNPDAAVTPGSIDEFDRHSPKGIASGRSGPEILNADGSLQISAWRNPPAAWEILLSQMKLYLLLPRRFRGELLLGGHWYHDRERQVPMLSGAAMLVRREVIDEVGGFDERFHMYGEDNEWCLRITRAGWRIVFQPEAVIFAPRRSKLSAALEQSRKAASSVRGWLHVSGTVASPPAIDRQSTCQPGYRFGTARMAAIARRERAGGQTGERNPLAEFEALRCVEQTDSEYKD